MAKRAPLTVVVAILSAMAFSLSAPMFAAGPAVPDQWKAMNTAELIVLAKQLGAQGDAGKANRTLLADYYASKFFTTPEATRAISADQWRLVVDSLRGDMSAATKAVWATKLRAGLAGDGKLLAATSFAEHDKLIGVLRMLRDSNTAVAGVKALFVENSTKLKLCTPDQIAGLAWGLKPLGTGGATAVAKLVAHATGYTANVAATKAVSPEDWVELAASMHDILSAEAKAQWISALRSAFVTDDKTLLSLGAKEADNLFRALSKLGDKDADRLRVVVGLTKLPDITTLSGDDLSNYARRIVAIGAPAAVHRGKFIAHIGTKYLASDAAAKSLTVKQWLDLAGVLDKQLSDDAKAQWAGRLRSTFASDEAVADMKRSDVRMVVDVLKKLKDTAPSTVVLTYLQASTVWKSFGPGELVGLTDDLRRGGKSCAAGNALLAEVVDSKYMVSTASVKSVLLGQWSSFAGRFRNDLSESAKKRWIAKLRQAFAGNAETIVALGDSDRGKLMGALRDLGDKDTSDLKGVSAETLKGWKSLDAEQIVNLSRRLSDADTKTRAEMIAHIDATYGSSGAAARTLSVRNWQRVSGAFRNDLSVSQRAKWISAIRSGFVGEELGGGELLTLAGELNNLGDGNSVGFIIEWTQKHASWKSWPLGDLSRLAGSVRKFSQADKLKTTLTEIVSAKYIGNTKAVQAAGLSRIASLAEALGAGFSDGDETAWIAGVRKAFAPSDEAITALSSGECSSLVKLLTGLGDANAGALSKVWFANKSKTDWSEASEQEMTAAIILAASAGDAKGAALMNELGAMAISAEMKISEKLTICHAFSNAWDRMKQPTKSQQWAMTAYEVGLGTQAARNQADMGTLGRVARILRNSGLTGKDKGYSCFAGALADLARAGKLYVGLAHDHSVLHLPLGDEASRKTVREALIDSTGAPRLAVGKVLAWTYRGSAEMKSWKTFVRGKIVDDDVTGDAKAIWLMIQAHSEAITPAMGTNPVRGLKSLGQAVIAAQTEPVRLTVVRELTEYHLRLESYRSVITLLGSIRNQFTSEGKGEIDKIRLSIKKQEKQAISDKAISNAKRALAAKQGRLTYYRKKLALAQKAGDQKAIKKFQQNITVLETAGR
jgi:hypothetical protein